jgi:hypothetical protein
VEHLNLPGLFFEAFVNGAVKGIARLWSVLYHGRRLGTPLLVWRLGNDDHVSLVLQSAGETDMAKDQDGDCWIWIDDAATVSQLVGEFVQE